MKYLEYNVPFNWYEIVKKEKDSTGAFEGYKVRNYYPGIRGINMSVGWISKEAYEDWKERASHYRSRGEWEGDIQLAFPGGHDE